MLLQVSSEGKVLQWLMDPDGSNINSISSVAEHKRRLYFGNVAGDYISILDKSDITGKT